MVKLTVLCLMLGGSQTTNFGKIKGVGLGESDKKGKFVTKIFFRY